MSIVDVSSRHVARTDARRGGFSLIELLVTVAIVGILAGLAIPNMRNVTFRARATAVLGDISVVRQATLDFNAAQNSWPPDTGSGTVPPGLVPFLPDGFSFSGQDYELDFENLTLPSGLPYDPSASRMVGLAITVTQPALDNAIVEVLGGAIVFSVGSTHTVVFDAS
jgi:prepilin-type N-terminal cleavage/methylation domain-containing protein